MILAPDQRPRLARKTFASSFAIWISTRSYNMSLFPVEFGKDADEGENETDELHRGWQDMISLFKWLREEGVK